MNYRSVVLPVLILLSMLPLAGCDKATPVAPKGTILAISANPTKIAINGTSTITVIGRKPDGNPLNPGTEIRMTASLGSIDTIVTSNSSGTATAIFRANGVFGVATIVASTGAGSTTGGGGTSDPGGTTGGTTASIAVQVGTAAKTITLQPTPTTLPAVIPVDGAKVTLLAVVRDSNGQPLANQGVNFTTDIGNLASRGTIVQTNAQGVARDTLTVQSTDLANNATAIHVTAESAGSDGALVMGAATISVVNGRPSAHFTYAPTADDHVVQFSNTSTGTGTLTYNWDFNDGQASNAQNPVHTYTSNGTFTVTLTVTDSNDQASVATAVITIPLKAGGSSS